MQINQSYNFLFGLIFNQSIRSETAWKLPGELKKRLKLSRLDSFKISQIDLNNLQVEFVRKPALHRFPKNMANNIFLTCNILNEEFSGDPGNIWKNQKESDIRKRLGKFPGIGSHKVKLGIFLLSFLEPKLKIEKTELINYLSIKCPNVLNDIENTLSLILVD